MHVNDVWLANGAPRRYVSLPQSGDLELRFLPSRAIFASGIDGAASAELNPIAECERRGLSPCVVQNAIESILRLSDPTLESLLTRIPDEWRGGVYCVYALALLNERRRNLLKISAGWLRAATAC
jgi:hypothetical protein